MAQPGLNPFIATEVISDPCLAALILAANPVAKKLALVRIALLLDYLPVLIAAANAARKRGIGVDTLDPHIQFRNPGNMRKIETWPECAVKWFGDWTGRVVRFHVGVER